MTFPQVLPYKISALIFLTNTEGKHLLMRRNKEPNKGKWSPIGGKLEMGTGESPFQCASREAQEETGISFNTEDFHLFSMIAEKAYQGQTHWLMFLFHCKKQLEKLPPDIDEGSFAFFSWEEMQHIDIPETDRSALWEVYQKHRHGFVCLRADCSPDQALEIIVEQTLPHE